MAIYSDPAPWVPKAFDTCIHKVTQFVTGGDTGSEAISLPNSVSAAGDFLSQIRTISTQPLPAHTNTTVDVSKRRRLRGINRRKRPPIGKSVSVSFRVLVVRASERARRSCVGV